MKDEEEYISEYEQWVMDNMSDESEPDNDEQTADDEDDELEEESALDRFRGDGTRKAIINMNQQMKMTVRLLFSIVVVILIIMFVLKTQFSPVTVVGNSMYPTMKAGDIVRTITDIKVENIHYDSIVCFKKEDSNSLIKRVVGLPGDTIAFKDGRVVINGIIREDQFPLMEEYPDTTIKLGADEFYCLGDNRNHSRDSRYYGPINISEITNIVYYNQNKGKETFDEMQELYELYKKGYFDNASLGDANAELATPGDAEKDYATPSDAIKDLFQRDQSDNGKGD